MGDICDTLKSFSKKTFDPAKDDMMVLPDDMGIYIICIRKLKKLPSQMRNLSYVFCCLGGHPIMYIGKSGRAGIRRRYRNHFNGTARGSTLRKSLGVLFEYERHYYNDGRYRFVEDDEDKLSEWMKDNLLFIYYVVDNLVVDNLEATLIGKYNPPLNLVENTSVINLDFRNHLLQLRRGFRGQETAESLIAYCRENRRVCPQPNFWHQLFQMLPNKRRTVDGWRTPSAPLILGGWGEDDDLKKERLAEHIRHAEQNNFLDEISRFLRGLREEDWFHGWGRE